MYQVTFTNIMEIRMGSPFNIADVDVKGGFFPKSGFTDFQDKFAVSQDGRVCYFVLWEVAQDNTPGFRMLRVSDHDQTATTSDRFSGCCEELSFLPGGTDGVQIKIWESGKETRTERVTAFS